MGRRHQSELGIGDPAEEPGTLVGPSSFLPGLTPHRFLPDPRATPVWRRVRKAVLSRDRSTCRRCGQRATDVDHRVELIDGGATFDPENLQALCGPCHDAKSSEARYLRATRAGSSWGRMALCPACSGSGRCTRCVERPHVCPYCLGIRFVPEVNAEPTDFPTQRVLAEVSSLAWAGAEPPPTEFETRPEGEPSSRT